jgi:hypothetical protein
MAQRAELGLETVQDVWLPVEAVEGPGQRDRHGLVAGEEQGDHFVSHPPIGQRPALVGAGRQQQAEDIVPLLSPSPPRRDRIAEELIDAWGENMLLTRRASPSVRRSSAFPPPWRIADWPAVASRPMPRFTATRYRPVDYLTG